MEFHKYKPVTVTKALFGNIVTYDGWSCSWQHFFIFQQLWLTYRNKEMYPVMRSLENKAPCCRWTKRTENVCRLPFLPHRAGEATWLSCRCAAFGAWPPKTESRWEEGRERARKRKNKVLQGEATTPALPSSMDINAFLILKQAAILMLYYLELRGNLVVTSAGANLGSEVNPCTPCWKDSCLQGCATLAFIYIRLFL